MSIILALAAAAAPLAPIAPLIGHCWRGTLPDGGIDTHCFARAGEGARDDHEVRRAGAIVYRGTTDYTVAAGAVRWAYRNDAGPVMAGGVAAGPGVLTFSVDGGPALTWRWQGKHAYVALAGPGRVPVTYRRIR